MPRIVAALLALALGVTACTSTADTRDASRRVPVVHKPAHPAQRARTHAAAPHRFTLRETRRPARATTGFTVCADGAVGVRAMRGGALPGEEVAMLVFTNRSTSACTLTGFPGVELFAHGAVLGRPAVRSGQPLHTLLLQPGTTVTARLRDASRCNAPLSDSVGVYAPDQTVQLRTPLHLRGCALTIDPVRGSR